MILIYGKGKTGNSLYEFCKNRNINAVLVDDNDFSTDLLKKTEKIVVSPGIPFYHQIYKEAKRKKIPVVGDIEFAYQFYKGKIIAITGTDGKTTTTKLIYELLKNAGFDAYIGGNYGIPFIEITEEANKNSVAVLELSSFQLYSTKKFRPDIALILNIDTDHLDWHKKRKHYVLSKFKITKNQTENDYLIINKSIKETFFTKARKLYIDLENHLNGDILYIEDLKININNLKLKGRHNLENITFAVITALKMGINPQIIKETVENFTPLPHRLEFVRSINGINFYNDSKSTTVHATLKALDSFEKDIILIAGGTNKGSDFSRLNNLISNKVKAVVLIGKDKEKIAKQLNFENTFLEENLESAVKKAYALANKRDTVLFSPACASFDMFKNYIDRGEKYKEIVNNL